MEEDTKKKKNQFGWKYQLRMNVEYYIGYFFWALKYVALLFGVIIFIVGTTDTGLKFLEWTGIGIGVCALYPLFNWISKKLMN